jgi:hypothetical protein
MRAFLTIAFISFLGLIRCAPTINYNLNGITSIKNIDLGKITISVQPFTDSRKDTSYLSGKIFDTAQKNDFECYNLQIKYGKLVVGNQMAKVLSMHLDSLKVFKTVFFNNKDAADLILNGNVSCFAAHSQINQSAQNAEKIGMALGPVFGIMGLVSSVGLNGILIGMKSNIDYEIKYTNIMVSDKNGNTIYEIPEYLTKANKKIRAVTDCGEIFGIINAELKEHNTKLLSKIVKELPKSLNIPK